MGNRNIWIMVAGLFLAGQVSAHDGKYHVSQAQLDELQRLATRLNDLSGHLLEEFDDAEVMPNPTHRSHFREDVAHIKAGATGNDGIGGWISRLGGALPPEPTFKSVEIPGHWIVGANGVTQNQSQATTAHGTDCALWTGVAREISGSYFESFTCGSIENVSPFANVGYFQYGSRGTLRVKVPGTAQVNPVGGNSVTGTNSVTKDQAEAYRSWRDVCHQWLRSSKSSYGARFVGASCGVPSNVSPYANVGYFLYGSTGQLYLKD